mmetsp:Transcript_19862/g.46515  ORF Transcript_19862/g.46515 Transcript_19862/m.46515 type:complete len:251 (-) Transcript_19862:472-1224(-)
MVLVVAGRVRGSDEPVEIEDPTLPPAEAPGRQGEELREEPEQHEQGGTEGRILHVGGRGRAAISRRCPRGNRWPGRLLDLAPSQLRAGESAGPRKAGGREAAQRKGPRNLVVHAAAGFRRESQGPAGRQPEGGRRILRKAWRTVPGGEGSARHHRAHGSRRPPILPGPRDPGTALRGILGPAGLDRNGLAQILGRMEKGPAGRTAPAAVLERMGRGLQGSLFAGTPDSRDGLVRREDAPVLVPERPGRRG